jgi:succinate dehydrogenase/fumarate reductase cytochrome b subunit
VRVVAPLAALLYPAIIWCGSRSSPIVLAISLVVPLLGLVASHHIAVADGLPRARRIAHLAVAAPPLFALLGGWLDFQRAIPIHGLGVWVVLWSAATLIALRERPHPELPGAPSRRLATAHGVSAAVITLFAVAHLGNHLGGLLGGDTHLAIMHALRRIYRHALVEPILLAAVAFQVTTGSVLLWRKLARSTGWFDTLQTTSGAYLMMFLLSHTSATLRARLLRGTDTNWAWLSGGELLTDPWSARLVPYYFLAVIAFGVHGACGLRTVALGHGASPALGARLVALGAGLSALISALILAALFRA